ncbi:siderophore-interacting protein [Mycetocola tolaasinivorans]|uniref:Siderophore-interacting protein n=1 Tax=Mycetocola tolaasinivorans TaxID=76635 RepID=A0A3L7AC31_9MICO|nr:siderophore-interacting protein [Mycetocola tolaasinivorans]RLP77278.1 siderophore-interacting protein [Mycetocola tolaasinivorans]
MSRAEGPIYAARVAAITTLSPQMRRIRVENVSGAHVPGISEYRDTGFADEFVTLGLPAAHTKIRTVKDLATADLSRRYYTVRARGREYLDLDFVLHGAGPGATWATHAEMGELILLGEPRGGYAPPAGCEWIALVGDATALPAIARILESHLGDAAAPPVIAVIQVANAAEVQPLAHRLADTVRWVVDAGDTGPLPEAVRDLTDRPGHGYVWFSGEASEMRTARAHLRHTLRWPTERWDTMGYWRRDHERWQRRLAALDPGVTAQLDEIYANEEIDPELARDRADSLLAPFGL